jgi:hypothetical protein
MTTIGEWSCGERTFTTSIGAVEICGAERIHGDVGAYASEILYRNIYARSSKGTPRRRASWRRTCWRRPMNWRQWHERLWEAITAFRLPQA